jgi:hypothetical protein
MRKLLRILFVILFFNCFTHASSNSCGENKRLNCITASIDTGNAGIAKRDEVSLEIHPLFILDFPF